jgi:hypothetical protein
MKLFAANKDPRLSAKFQDLTGMKFGRLTVIEYAGQATNSLWLCRCECGNEKVIKSGHFKNGSIKSCGCLNSELSKLRATTHGQSGRTREYKTWQNMKSRCSNPKNNRFYIYGARGITVCNRWLHSFENFFSDMGKCPNGMSIERVDVNGNYEHSNCKWATRIEQANNTRSNHVIKYNGEELTITEWGRKIGISQSSISGRLTRGWPIDLAVTLPKEPYKHLCERF